MIKSIHWWANGKSELDTIDRFIKLWISLEILVEGKGKKVVNKVKTPLINLYPKVKEEKIGEIVGLINGKRGNIVHLGLRNPEEVIKYTQQLEAILDDLLCSKLYLPFRAEAEKYLYDF